MRMKEVCEKTGLTEKSVRLYLQRGLVAPQVKSTERGNAYIFTEADVGRLRTIASLRGAGFHLAEIERALAEPAALPALVAEKQAQAAAEVRRAAGRKELLERLGPAERGDPVQLAAALDPPGGQRQEEETGSAAVPIVLGVLVVLGFATVIWYHWPGWSEALLYLRYAGAVIGPVLGIAAFFMAGRYAGCTRRAAKLPLRAQAVVASVEKVAGFDSGYARVGNQYASLSEQGRGGVWQIFFLLWNTVRPDHWFPVLQYRDAGGILHGATLPYGGLKGNFRAGEELEVAYSPKTAEQVLPLHAPWLAAKAAAYALLGLALLAGAVVLWMGAVELWV